MMLSQRCLWTLAVLSVVPLKLQAQDAAATAPTATVNEPPPVAIEPVPAETAAGEDAEPPPPAAEAQTPTATAAGADEGTLSPEELAAMGFGTTSSAGAPPVDTSLKISGFIDVTYSGQKSPENSLFRGIFNRHGSFWIGNVNLYVAKDITESVRTMFEVRFSYLPNGTPIVGSTTGEYFNTAAADYNDAGRPQRWGGIVMQRAYLEWAPHSAATFRIGQYLTPYGIWNVDHGSPAIISVMRPFIVGAQMFPERQTGLQLLGRLPFADNHTISYSLTLSNGFGPLSEYRDLDNNAAFGGRIAWACDAFGQLALGGSWFVGKDTSAVETLAILPSGKVGYNEKITEQSDVLSLAADLRWAYEGLLLQSEVITQQRKFTEVGRVGSMNPAAGGIYIAPKDALSWGWYGLLGYRLPWLGIMPYVMATYNKIYDLTLLGYAPGFAVLAGFNIRPLDAVVLKLEYGTVKLLGRDSPTDARLHLLQAQLAWAF